MSIYSTLHINDLRTIDINMSGQKSKQNVSTSSPSVVAPPTASSDTTLARQRVTQNFLLIWIDASIDESKQSYQNTLAQLQSVVNEINIFTQRDECVDFLTEVDDMKAFLIMAGNIGQHIVPLIHDITQLDTIYIFYSNKSEHEQWTKDWNKIKGVHTDITCICEALQLAVKEYNQDSIPMSFVTVTEEIFCQNLNQLDSSFMYTQIFKEILLEMEHDEKSIKNLAIYCRNFYNDNMRELNIINEFEYNYRSKSPIWWYTRECFTYQMLNRALRTLEAGTIINMGFFIRDLHQQIDDLHRKQADSYYGKSFIIYRGQGLSITDFEKLQKTKGGLMSFNNFLSTSKNREVSLRFAKGASLKTDMIGILFKMTVKPSICSAPFASIQEVSYYKTEEEILFSMHTVFRIGDITKIDNNSLLYQVALELTADDDQELRTLTDRIRKEVVGKTGWRRLGLLLLNLSQFDMAEKLYNVLLEQSSDESTNAFYYNQLGYIKSSQGDCERAIHYSKKALQIEEKTLPSNHRSLATSYSNIGTVYYNMGEYSKALSFYKKAFEIEEKTLPSNHPRLAISYNNIGSVYMSISEYSTALSFYEKALEIEEKTLPSNHPGLAISYNNIGSVYMNISEYSTALSFYGKALEIRQKTLPSNHPDLAVSYNNIGSMYDSMEEYSKALSFYEKTLEIFEQTLPPNHPDLATSYNNIASAYVNMKEYSKSLSFYGKTREIFEKTLPSNHPLFGTFFNNIGSVYMNMDEYATALPFFRRALNIFQNSLPSNHPNIQIVQRSIEVLEKIVNLV